jgi:general secretion pathway protein I
MMVTATRRQAARPTRAVGTHAGFTLIEILVALAIVSIALLAGSQAVNALSRSAQRQSDVLIAQMCAENELIKLRLSRQLPSVGDSSSECTQAGKKLMVRMEVHPTPNPSFRKVDMRVFEGDNAILNISTIASRF